MSGRRVLTGIVLTLLLLLAAGIACAEAAVPVRVAYLLQISAEARIRHLDGPPERQTWRYRAVSGI